MRKQREDLTTTRLKVTAFDLEHHKGVFRTKICLKSFQVSWALSTLLSSLETVTRPVTIQESKEVLSIQTK